MLTPIAVLVWVLFQVFVGHEKDEDEKKLINSGVTQLVEEPAKEQLSRSAPPHEQG
jgi:hypothetical protein